MKQILRLAVLVILILTVCLSLPESWLEQNTKLDGEFDDWTKQACLEDLSGDSLTASDFKSISWNSNVNEEKLYFMVERFSPQDKKSELICRLYFDINASEGYQDRIDKYADIVYSPGIDNTGQVTVTLYSISGHKISTYSGSWGEGYQQGGRRFEFAIPLQDLEVYPAQSLMFYLSSMSPTADRLPDYGDNQISPFPGRVKSRPLIIILIFIWLALTIFFLRHRIWIFYYVWGAVGLSCLLVLLFRASFVEYQLEQAISLILHHVLNYFDILTYVFDKAPGTLLVLIKIDSSWTTIDIDIENSGMLEMCIIVGLILFYPAYNRIKRALLSLMGILLIFSINIIRLLVVIIAVEQGGRNLSFIAHTVLGRLVFFLLIVVVYWYLLTRPSLKKTREKANYD